MNADRWVKLCGECDGLGYYTTTPSGAKHICCRCTGSGRAPDTPAGERPTIQDVCSECQGEDAWLSCVTAGRCKKYVDPTLAHEERPEAAEARIATLAKFAQKEAAAHNESAQGESSEVAREYHYGVRDGYEEMAQRLLSTPEGNELSDDERIEQGIPGTLSDGRVIGPCGDLDL